MGGPRGGGYYSGADLARLCGRWARGCWLCCGGHSERWKRKMGVWAPPVELILLPMIVLIRGREGSGSALTVEDFQAALGVGQSQRRLSAALIRDLLQAGFGRGKTRGAKLCIIVQLQLQYVGGTNSAKGARAGVPSHNESMTDKRSPALTAPTPSLDPWNQFECNSVWSSRGGYVTPFQWPYPPPAGVRLNTPYSRHPKGRYHALPLPLMDHVSLRCLDHSCTCIAGSSEDEQS